VNTTTQNMPRRNSTRPTKRAFRGLVGSPLAEIIPFPESKSQAAPASAPAPKRGRPPKHMDAAAKQKAYRERKNSPFVIEKPPSTDNQLMIPILERGFIPDADHGRGLLVTGGYSPAKIAAICAAADRDENGRRVHPKGYGANADEEMTSLEKKNVLQTDRSFTRKIHFPKIDKLDDAEKRQILLDLARENTEDEPAQDLEDVAAQYRKDYRTVRCLLCDQILGTSLWPLATDGFTLLHFLSTHPRLVRKAWKANAPKRAPKRCTVDHVGTAKRLHEHGDEGAFYCKSCRKLVFDSKYFRNEPPMYVKRNTINELTQTIDLNPMYGEVETPPSTSPSGPGSPIKTESFKEVVHHEREAA
jgi:hypothetical protein